MWQQRSDIITIQALIGVLRRWQASLRRNGGREGDRGKRKKSQEESENPTYFTEYVIPEGTEVINRLAFDRTFLYSVTLPSTLKTVEEGAFWVEPRVPVGRNNQETNRDNDFDWDLEYRDMDVVVCNSIVPPELIGYPLANTY